MPFSSPIFLFILFPFFLLVSVLSLVCYNRELVVSTYNNHFKELIYINKFLSVVIEIIREIGLFFFKVFNCIFRFVKLDFIYNYATSDNIKTQNFIIFFINFFFYAFAGVKSIGIVIPICLINYIGGLIVERIKYKRIALWFFIIINLSILSFYKYFSKYYGIIAPIGISFITFRLISYICDIYYNKNKAQYNLFNFIQYVMFFPQVISGPIMRYGDFNSQLQGRKIVFDDVIIGVKKFIFGFAKKVIIADKLGLVVDKIFKLQTTEYGSFIAWVGILFYSMQLYYDFSGYCDMAIGFGKILGFNTPENFNYPYISKSITEFWRRWHITLGSWFKDYLYIPLGGNRVSKIRMYFNLWIVFLATGIWHGNTLNFLIWGVIHGVFIVIEKATNLNKDKNNKILTAIQHFYCLSVILFSWIIFRSPSLQYAIDYIKNMFGILKLAEADVLSPIFISKFDYIIFVIACLFVVPIFKNFINKKNNLVMNILLVIIFVVSISFATTNTYQAFLYFQF
ncbi:MAG: hypothetical protein LBC92_02355 [Rickettsiales bacterium]|jgi:alginate O-acetyltransferase complex protein AlgI|nr:hypothetical protein [Rickettsiales bacterium]